MARQFFKDLPDTSTPLTASRLNGLLDGEEAMGNLVVDSIRSKNTLQNGVSANTNSYGITVKTNDDGSVSLTGTQTTATIYFTNVKRILAKNIENGNYTLSFNNATLANIAYRIRKYNGSTKTTIVNETLLSSADYSYTFNLKGLIDNDTTQVEIDIICYGTNAKNVSLSPQLELGDTATTYSPYQELNGFSNPIQLLGDTTLAASTSYALSDDITNYRYIMLVLTSTNNFANANRQYIPVSQITSYDNTNRYALSVFQSATVYMFADMYFNDATHIYCNTISKGSVGWDGHLKVYGII